MTRRAATPDRCGVTLLEVMTTLALSATLMTSSMVVLRSSYATWRLHEEELDRAGAANAVLRHLVRGVRQANAVTAVTATAAPNGALSVQLNDGLVATWTYSSGTVLYQMTGGSPQTLSDNITGLSFTGYEADGVTTTDNPSDIHALRCAVTTTLPSGANRTASSFTWVRAW
ncbi:prepilin-type N-terminal cleavage/methylation domain-containing protein [Botrimarina hoheduenensis]|uniref:Prepilin-type N-terminal cleavage/methylation domain-containing protein n=1 Tax=Botrimarina hoheduenensis TaxID=2528000 RepID=A0A5C5WE40_9BACT|nr:prepilin-type N-terminal cleavage/methylation domain-containing protein [Botrimarina hoheduenensis]TWT48870.1 hypothetical protein Pla111_06460 [Botrimarina hoheduenensis]